MTDEIELLLALRPYRVDGGAERFHARLLRQLRQSDLPVRCRILGPSRWPLEDEHEEWPCYPVRQRALLRHQRVQRQWAALEQLAEHLRVQSRSPTCLVQSQEPLLGCDIYRLGDGLHADWLAQRHASRMPWQRRLALLDPFHRMQMHRQQTVLTSSRTRVVVSNSPALTQRTLSLYPELDGRLVTIAGSVNCQLFQPLDPLPRITLRQQLMRNPNATLALFCGSGWERKNLGLLLQALALHARRGTTQSVQGLELHVLGTDRQAARYQRQAGRLGLAHCVHFHGPVSHTVDWFAAADVLLHPALYDPYPNVVLEAWASGCPTIVSEQTGQSVCCAEMDDRLVLPATDPAAWAELLTELVDQAYPGGPAAWLLPLRQQVRRLALAHDDATQFAKWRALYLSLASRDACSSRDGTPRF